MMTTFPYSALTSESETKMIPKELSRLVGLSCTSIKQAYHIWKGQIDRAQGGPVEMTWSDGSRVSLDGRSDWTLRVQSGPWHNYYEGCSRVQLKVLAIELGLWKQESVSRKEPIRPVLRRPLQTIEEILSRYDELMGVIFHFPDASLRAATWAGEVILCSQSTMKPGWTPLIGSAQDYGLKMKAPE